MSIKVYFFIQTDTAISIVKNTEIFNLYFTIFFKYA